MHTHTYTQVYTCMRIPIHIHMQIYTYMHIHTHTYIHTYTHTHTICTYARTQARLERQYCSNCVRSPTTGTTVLQQLREKPNLTPRKLRTSPLEVVVPPPFNEIRSTTTTGKRKTITTDSSSSHYHDRAPPRQQPIICTGAEPICSVHGPPKLQATESMLRNRI